MISLLFVILTWVCIFLIGYTYVGYPLILALLQQFYKRKTEHGDIQPDLTMIVPTYNEEKVIRRKIENTLSLDYNQNALQIIIIDDDSDDETRSIVNEYTDRDVELIHKADRSGKMESLQLGVARARGDILVMSDASPSYSDDSLKIMVRHFNDPHIGIVVGDLALWDAENSVAKPAGLYWKYEATIRRWESNIGSTIAMHGNMYMIRKELFPMLSKQTINDEWSIAMRTIQQGYRVYYEPDAISYDDVSKKMSDEFKRRIRINAGRYQAFFGAQGLWPWNDKLVIFEIISHKMFRLFLPFFMIGALAFNILTVLTGTSQAMVFLLMCQIIFYVISSIGYLTQHNSGKAWYFRILNIFYFLTSSNIAAFYGFLRFITNRQSVKWEKVER